MHLLPPALFAGPLQTAVTGMANLWLLNCNFPVHVWGVCPMTVLTWHGSGGSLHPSCEWK